MAHPIRPDSYIKMDNFYTVSALCCCGVCVCVCKPDSCRLVSSGKGVGMVHGWCMFLDLSLSDP